MANPGVETYYKGGEWKNRADHLGHARPSMTQDVYMGRNVASSPAAEALGQVNGE
jgi:hypothetical protein